MADHLSFTRKRVRGGIVRICIGDRFMGEIATVRWGYAIRLPGIYWDAEGRPATSGISQKSFKRQREAIEFVKSLPNAIHQRAAETCERNKLEMA